MSSPISPEHVYHLRTVADPALSPDGSRLAYTQSWVDQESLDSRSRIMVLETASGLASEFTQGVKDTAAKYSPDGRQLAFLRPDGSGKRQVWVMGATGGEARPLAAVPSGVVDFAWSPDSQRLVLCADVEPDNPAPQSNPQGLPQVRVVRRIRYRYDTLGWRGDSHFHLFIADANGDTSRQITHGDWDDLAPVWSPDGAYIAFLSGRRDDRDLRSLTEAYVVPAEGGEPVLRSQGLSDVGAVAWSPDGRRLAAIGSEEDLGLVLWQAWLYVLEPGESPRRLTDDGIKPYLSFPAITRPPDLRWTSEDKILFLGEQRGESFLFEAPISEGPARAVSGGGGQSTSLTLDQAARKAVVLASSPSTPGDLHGIDLQSHASTQLTDLNAAYLAGHPAAAMEKFSFQRDGWEIECRLWFPAEFDPSRQYPLVLDIHGGPNGAFYDSFVPLQQVLATAGHLVLAVNPRGSSTYGNDFMLAVLKDWGGEDYQDLMAAVDLVSERPYVDTSRLGVHGYSYGGYMTSWIAGHTDRFRAAVAGAPCIDLFSMYGTSDIGVSFGEVQWGGSLVDAATELIKHSPITYASNVTAPVLLLHGEADARCPIGQSEEYFVVLKRLGKEVELVRFPDCSHAFPRIGHPKMRQEYMRRTLGWFQKYLA
ncbi:MAG: S9 family peptidase [Chloroflexi bacterium]|nr:S9 family peptidase [Chloroflexota bacterium]MCI0894967.1 S9 family peptidase [Chloroflexota bacterium]